MQHPPSLLRSKIAARISRKLAFIYTAIYLLLLLSLLAVLTPILYRDSVKRETQLHSIFTEEYAALQTQLSESMNSLRNDFFLLLDTYVKLPDDASRALIVQALSSYAASYHNYAAVGVSLPSGEYISSFYYTNIQQRELLDGNVHYQNLLSTHSNSYYSPIYTGRIYTEKTTYMDANYDDLIYFSKNYSYGVNTYTLTVFYKISETLQKNNTLNASSFNSYLILDKYDDVIYTTDTALSEPLRNYLLEDSFKFSSSVGRFRFQKGLCFYKSIPATGWRVFSYVSFTRMLQDLLLILGLVTALYLISPILYNIFLVSVTKKQLAPLKNLADTMAAFHAGEDIRSEINTRDEIEDLSDVFNKMVVEINAQVKDIGLKEHENSVVNYKLLATQIDPHFIYNTMNIINIMARQGNTSAIVEINTALVRILRERLNSKLSIHDTVKNEYDTMIQYEVIMNYRYQHQVEIHYDIDDALMDMEIPKNILQPLVENAFYHGFGDMDIVLHGHIDIMIYAIEENLIIEVSDDGKGISPERLSQVMEQDYSIYKDKKPHIGVNNIRQRLNYIYQGNYQMEIHSTEGLGTTVIITIPKQMPAEFTSA